MSSEYDALLSGFTGGSIEHDFRFACDSKVRSHDPQHLGCCALLKQHRLRSSYLTLLTSVCFQADMVTWMDILKKSVVDSKAWQSL